MSRSKSSNVLPNAIKEEDTRRSAQYDELIKLFTITSKAIKESSIDKKTVLEELSRDIEITEKINSTFKAGTDPYPLVYNKLVHLLKGAKILVEKHFSQIESGDFSFIPIPKGFYAPNPYSEYTTSLPNYAQTAMLEILSIVRKAPVDKIPDLQKEKIYNINLSPNIQGVKAADKSTLEPVADWKWCSKEKGYPELIVPGSGYYFGGSRYDDAYNSKLFRYEDCSSGIAKLIGADEKTFTTNSILNMEGNASPFLKSIGADRTPIKGDIFCFKGHCGVVVEYSDSKAPISSLSYTRSMPFSEGLIYQQYHQVNDGKNVVTADWMALSRLNVVEYYGLDNPLGNISEPKISGDIFYYETV